MDQNIESVINSTLSLVDECESRLDRLEKKAVSLNMRVIERKVVNDEVTPKSKAKTKNRAANQAALKLLMDTYPKTFDRENVKPLKIGIQDDLLAEEKVAKNKIKRALASYVRSPQYFRSMIEGVDRVDLQGEAAGKVTSEEAEHAKGQLKEFHQRRREAAREQEKQKRVQEREDRISSKLDQLVALNKR